MKNIILKNRYTLLVVTLVVYTGVLVAEGAITGREVRVFEFENPFFDFNVNNFEGFGESRSDSDRDRDRDRDRDEDRDEASGDV
ncbi:MAG: hypothetical protein HOI69_11975 [Gammaproteobacteria bacterium]|nr:hypothetical protein [Gammaproteobacteria bacterium]